MVKLTNHKLFIIVFLSLSLILCAGISEAVIGKCPGGCGCQGSAGCDKLRNLTDWDGNIYYECTSTETDACDSGLTCFKDDNTKGYCVPPEAHDICPELCGCYSETSCYFYQSTLYTGNCLTYEEGRSCGDGYVCRNETGIGGICVLRNNNPTPGSGEQCPGGVCVPTCDSTPKISDQANWVTINTQCTDNADGGSGADFYGTTGQVTGDTTEQGYDCTCEGTYNAYAYSCCSVFGLDSKSETLYTVEFDTQEYCKDECINIDVSEGWDDEGLCCGDDAGDCAYKVDNSRKICSINNITGSEKGKWYNALDLTGDVLYIPCDNHEFLSDATTWGWIRCDPSTLFGDINIEGGGGLHNYRCVNESGKGSITECCGPSECNIDIGADTEGGRGFSTGESLENKNGTYYCTEYFDWTADLDEIYKGNELGNDEDGTTCNDAKYPNGNDANFTFTKTLCCGDDSQESYSDYSPNGKTCYKGNIVSSGKIIDGLIIKDGMIYKCTQNHPPLTEPSTDIKLYIVGKYSGTPYIQRLLDHLLWSATGLPAQQTFTYEFSADNWQTVNTVGKEDEQDNGELLSDYFNTNNCNQAPCSWQYDASQADNETTSSGTIKIHLALDDGTKSNDVEVIFSEYSGIVDAGTCKILPIPGSQKVCSVNGTWATTTEADLELKQWNNGQSSGCCRPNQCWNGSGCINEQSASDILDYNGYRCLSGGWRTASEIKTSPYGDFGVCEDTRQCVYNSAPGGEISCVSAGNYSGDFYCDEGSWTTRTKLIALHLLSMAGNDYTLMCGNYLDVLNDVNYYPSNTKASAYFSSDKVNNVCVLNSDGRILMGASLNQNIDVETNDKPFLGAIGKTLDYCENAKSENGIFNRCNGDVWYNQKLRSVIFSNEDTSFSIGTAAASFSEFILNPISGVLAWIKDKVIMLPEVPGTDQEPYDYSLVQQLKFFNNLFLAKKGSMGVAAVLEAPAQGEDYIVIDYYGFTDDPCPMVEAYSIEKNSDGDYYYPNIVCEKVDDKYYIATKDFPQMGWTQPWTAKEIWKDLTSKLNIK